MQLRLCIVQIPEKNFSRTKRNIRIYLNELKSEGKEIHRAKNRDNFPIYKVYYTIFCQEVVDRIRVKNKKGTRFEDFFQAG